MQIQSPELLNQIAEWKRKSADGTISLPEMREAIIALRQNRLSAIAAAGAAKRSAKSKGPTKSAEDLLSELDNL